MNSFGVGCKLPAKMSLLLAEQGPDRYDDCESTLLYFLRLSETAPRSLSAKERTSKREMDQMAKGILDDLKDRRSRSDAWERTHQEL